MESFEFESSYDVLFSLALNPIRLHNNNSSNIFQTVIQS